MFSIFTYGMPLVTHSEPAFPMPPLDWELLQASILETRFYKK